MPHIPIRLDAAATRLLLCCLLLGPLAAAELHMTPDGAGTKDGSSWENALAYSASPTSLQEAWDRLQPGDTCLLGPGAYEARTLNLHANGTDAAGRRTLRGVITDGKRPVFTGTWSKQAPDKGIVLFQIATGATWWAIENIGIRNCLAGVATQSPGRVAHGRLSNLAMEEVREGVILIGGATATQPELGTHDLAIEDCSIVHYTKRGFRFRDGCYDIRLERCLADAGGKDWAVEAFHMGYSIAGGGNDSGVSDHDLTFVDCITRNNYWDTGEGRYWQGDGFCAERATYNLTFIGCESYDNGDGGWDVKSANPLLIGCIAMRNKKNFRFWADEPGVLLVRCVGAYAFKRGGNSEATGIWVGGKTRAIRCSFVENGDSIVMNDYKVTAERRARMALDLDACLVTLSESQQAALEAFPTVTIRDSTIWRSGGQAGEAVGYAATDEAHALAAAGQAFDSATQPDKGYRSSWRQEDLLASARAQQPLLPTVGHRLPAKPIMLYQGRRLSSWYVGGWNGADMGESTGAGREGRSALALSATGDGGGAKLQTKNAGAAINLADREPAAWTLCFGMRSTEALPDGLQICAISLDKAEATKELTLRTTPGEGGWREVRMPLADFAKDPKQELTSFAGFFIRVRGKLASPIYIDQVRLEPVR